MEKDAAGTYYAALEKKITDWAQGEEAIRLAIVVGSRARHDRPADRWSDLDIIFFTSQADHYLNRLDWITAFAPVWLTVTQKTAGGDPERLVLFEGGWQTDFVFADSAVLSQVPEMLRSGNTPEIIRRGVRVLVDKDSVLAYLPPREPVPMPPPPTQEDLNGFWERFWFYSVYQAKQLCRGELARYKGGEEGMRSILVQLIEWHARATLPGGQDTWHAGRFLEDWAAPGVYEALTETYTPLDAAASKAGLLALVSLFRRLVAETCTALGMQHPDESKDAELFAYLRDLCA